MKTCTNISLAKIFECKAFFLVLLTIFLFFLIKTSTAQIGFGTDSVASDAEFQIYANDKGILLPKVSTAEMTSIQDPALALLLYNSSLKTIVVFDSAKTNNWSVANPWSSSAESIGPVSLHAGFKLGLGTTPSSSEMLAISGTLGVKETRITNHTGSNGSLSASHISVSGTITTTGTFNANIYTGVGFFPRGTILIWDRQTNPVPQGWEIVSLSPVCISDTTENIVDVVLLDLYLPDINVGIDTLDPQDPANKSINKDSQKSENINNINQPSMNKAIETRFRFVYIVKTF